MSEATLSWRVGMLERRIARVEARLAIAPETVEEETREEEPRTVRELVEMSAPPAPVVPPPRAVPPPLPSAPSLPPLARPAVVRPVLPYRPVASRPSAPQGVLEQAIGLKWAGWVGAIVLVVGAGLGIKFAYDQGWFGAIPAGARLVLMSLAGFGLIGAGELVLRRVNRISATGLFGAGVALLFVVSYAGYGFYALYERNTAFVLMALATIVGALVARRGRLVSIGVLSLIGGNLAPVLLHSAEPNLAGFFAYLLMLQVVALVLAWWGAEPKWWALRGLSMAGNALWMLAVLWSRRAQSPIAAEMTFALISAVMYQVELIASAWRAGAAETKSLQAASPGVVFSTLVTAALTGAVLVILRGSTDGVRGAWVLAVAAAVGVTGLLLRRQRGDERLSALGLGYRVQAAALVVVAAPVMLSGLSVEIGWCALAVAFAVLGWLLDLRVSRLGAVVTWLLAVAHLQWRVSETLDAVARSVWFTIRGVGIPAYFLIACGLGVVGHVVADLAGRGTGGSARKLTWVATVGGTVVWVAASVAGLPPLGATLALVVYGWVMMVADVVSPRLGAAVQGAVVLVLATAKWVLVDLLAERLSAQWSAAQYAAVMNPAMGIGCLIATSLVALFWLRRRQLAAALRRWGMGDDAEREAVLFTAALVIGLMAIGISFEVDRFVERRALFGGGGTSAALSWHVPQLRQMLLSMVWSLAACGQLALARQIEPSKEGRRRWLARVGWVPTLIAVKFLVLDTLVYRGMYGPAPVVMFANLQVICAATVVGALLMIALLAAEAGEMTKRGLAAALIVLILLWVGCLEIDRAFERMAAAGTMQAVDAELAKQVALSINGAVFAIVAVAAGFSFRAAGVRYFGLGLFALTLLKVVFVDLAHAGQGYRVLSFLGLGLLLLGTSVLYGKLSPRLLGRTT